MSAGGDAPPGRPEPTERLRFARIARGDSGLLNPIELGHLDELIAALPDDDARVVDIGCGHGDFLVRLSQRRRVQGCGIDLDEATIRKARRLAAARTPGAPLAWHCADARTMNRSATYDIAIAMGARDATGRYHEAIPRLVGLVRDGGEVVIGDGYWKAPPNARLLESLGFDESELPTLPSIVSAARTAGLIHRQTIVTGVDVHDRYYERRWANCRRFAERHPRHPDVPGLLAWSRQELDRHFRLGGREQLGFAVLLFKKSKPTARAGGLDWREQRVGRPA